MTLFCQMQKNGGDWKRQYLMRPGNVEIEEVTEATDWLGVENYRKRLASAGLSPAMSKVLALEQGETDKLCEYAPRQLLDLVFQVFGDKEVLDAYDEAKRHQRDTETELKRFEAELETSRINLEGLRLRVANYHQWEDLHKERRDLVEEVLPSLEYHEAREKAAQHQPRSCAKRRSRWLQADSQLTEKRNALAAQQRALTEAQQQEVKLEQEANALASRLDADQRQTQTAGKPARTEGTPAKAGRRRRRRHRRSGEPAGSEGSGTGEEEGRARRAVRARSRASRPPSPRCRARARCRSRKPSARCAAR